MGESANLANIGQGVSSIASLAPLITSFSQFSLERTASKIQEQQGEADAKKEELAAIQREADRKGRLAVAMASQIAQAGAKGIAAFEGSPLSILQEDIRAEEVATERDIFSSKLAALTLRSRGKTAGQLTRTRALIGLGADLTRIAPSLPMPEKKTPEKGKESKE